MADEMERAVLLAVSACVMVLGAIVTGCSSSSSRGAPPPAAVATFDSASFDNANWN